MKGLTLTLIDLLLNDIRREAGSSPTGVVFRATRCVLLICHVS